MNKIIILFIIVLAFFMDCNTNSHYDSHKVPDTILLKPSRFNFFKLDDDTIFNEASGSYFSSIQSIKYDNENNILLTDLNECKINKINFDGILLNSIGIKGKENGEFTNGPTRLSFDHINNRFAVVDFKTQFINVYDDKLHFLKKIVAPIAVSDIDFDDNGQLLIAMPPNGISKTSIVILDPNLEIVKAFDPIGLYGDPLIDMFSIKYNPFTKSIFIMFYYRNIIQEYNYQGQLLNQFSIPGLPEISEINKEGFLKPKELPLWRVLRSFSIDREGNLYILYGGPTSKSGKMIIRINRNNEYCYQNLADEMIAVNSGSQNSLYFIQRYRSRFFRYKVLK